MLNEQFYGDIYASLNEILIDSHTIICHGDNNELLIYWMSGIYVTLIILLDFNYIEFVDKNLRLI